MSLSCGVEVLCVNVCMRACVRACICEFMHVDLTFNNIKVIQGLDKCTRLTDLALSHNLISKVEGLDSLKNLQVVTFGHNCIEDIQEVRYTALITGHHADYKPLSPVTMRTTNRYHYIECIIGRLDCYATFNSEGISLHSTRS